MALSLSTASLGRAFFLPPKLVILVYRVIVVKLDRLEAELNTEKLDEVAFMSPPLSGSYTPLRVGGKFAMFSCAAGLRSRSLLSISSILAFVEPSKA